MDLVNGLSGCRLRGREGRRLRGGDAGEGKSAKPAFAIHDGDIVSQLAAGGRPGLSERVGTWYGFRYGDKEDHDHPSRATDR